MTNSKDTLQIQWLMLLKIPHYPHLITTKELKDSLNAEGYDIDISSIEGNLNDLSLVFPLSNEKIEQKIAWFWAKEAEFTIPSMTTATALGFQIAKSHLTTLLPENNLNELQPYFKQAEITLQSSSLSLKSWSKKVSIINQGLNLVKPLINSEIKNTIYQALLEEKQLKVSYKKRDETTSKEYLVHPLGLIHREGVIYLVCTFWNYEKPMQLAFHRFDSVKLINEPANSPKFFNFNDYIQKEKKFSYPSSQEPIELKLLFNTKAAEHLYETKLTENQTLTIQENGQILLEASILQTKELEWWLRGFGALVKIIEPSELRDHFKKQARALNNLYCE